LLKLYLLKNLSFLVLGCHQKFTYAFQAYRITNELPVGAEQVEMTMYYYNL
jgi:hypothetical protein